MVETQGKSHVAPKQAIQIPGLLSHPPEQQKQMIGEHIYVRVFE